MVTTTPGGKEMAPSSRVAIASNSEVGTDDPHHHYSNGIDQTSGYGAALGLVAVVLLIATVGSIISLKKSLGMMQKRRKQKRECDILKKAIMENMW